MEPVDPVDAERYDEFLKTLSDLNLPGIGFPDRDPIWEIMDRVMPFVCMAVAASSLWLVVRIINRRERWAKRTAAVLLVLGLAYPLSRGPANWLESLDVFPWFSSSRYFVPVTWCEDQAPRPIQAAYNWYLGLWAESRYRD